MVCLCLASMAWQILAIAPASGQGGGMRERIRIAYPTPNISFLPLSVARRQGLFAAENLEPQLILMKANVALVALLSGHIEYMTAMTSAVAAALKGLPVRVVAGLLANSGDAIVARPEIRSIQGLRGKKLGVTAPGIKTDFQTRVILKAAGINPDREVMILSAGTADQRFAAIKSGVIDASLIAPPLNLLARSQGFTLLDVGEAGEVPSTGLAVRQSGLETGRLQLKRLLRGLVRSLRLIRAPSMGESIIQFMVREMGLQRSVAEMTHEYALRIGMFNGDGLLSQESLLRAVELAAGRPVDATTLGQVFDFTLLKEVHQELAEKG